MDECISFGPKLLRESVPLPPLSSPVAVTLKGTGRDGNIKRWWDPGCLSHPKEENFHGMSSNLHENLLDIEIALLSVKPLSVGFYFCSTA